MAVTNPNSGRSSQSTNSVVRRFFICSEGEKTEVQYFKHLNYIIQNVLEIEDIKLELVPRKYGTGPMKVLQSMKEYLQRTSTKSYDEMWLVVDRDKWTETI